MKADVTQSIPNFGANSEQWIQFHEDLNSSFGKKVANSIWIKAWGIRGSSAANTSILRQYLAKHNIKIDESSWDKTVDFGSDVTDFFGNIFSVGKYAGIALGAILIGGLGMLVYNIAKNPIAAAKVALQAKQI